MTTWDSNSGQSESEVYGISSFLCCFVHPPTPTCSFIHPSIFLSTHSPTHLLRLLSISPSRLTLHSPSHPPVLPPSIPPASYRPTFLLFHPPIYLFTHPFVHSPIHLLIHPANIFRTPTACQTTFLPWWRLQASGGGVRKQLG